MKFQIEELIIWPQKIQFPPREIKFHLGKVNVITGASRTGKTAIIPIIDYCLGSATCSIPINEIRDNAVWYGVVVVTDYEKILFARKIPDGNKVSTEYFFLRGKSILVPNVIRAANQTLDGVKELLNSISNIPFLGRDEEETGYTARLSFRDLTHLVFQSQDIVANQSILFYKTHETEHREKLKIWLPFIFGSETAELIRARRELKNLEAELRRQQKEYDQANELSKAWLQNLLGKLNVAREYGLYDGHQPQEVRQDELLIIAKSILRSEPETPKTSEESLTQARKEIHELEKQENELSQKIALIVKRQKDIEALEKNLGGYQNNAKRKVERLGISEWLRKNGKEPNICPFCGGTDHSSAKSEIEKICTALESYERISLQSLELPVAFQREKDDLKHELIETTEEMQLIHNRFDVLRAKDEEAAKYLQRSQDMFTFLGELKFTVELVERLSDAGELDLKIREINRKIADLKEQIALSHMKERLDRSLAEISTLALIRLKTLDVEPKYQNIAPQFSLKELGIQVVDEKGVWHLLTEVGSASNWVSFHIALTCALQEYFVRQTNPISTVPSFVIYDQPSQVYFPKIRKEEEKADPTFDDEDVTAVKKIFTTLANSVHDTEGAWQVIILDHARSEIYEDIEGVVEIEEWRNGKKLIPEIWYKE
ncbi:MAG: DUF3732 domain-containing protein [Holosporaceae bacterium]|jgi:hypothetical protein|nr:DUF3732 domain-containing protein [Holosporaceae bacterium]